MNNTVSVYIPTHNRRTLLERAITSVREQTYRDLEIIVVNDASSDDTRPYLDQLRTVEPRLVVHHHDTPRGAPAARNLAIRTARGTFTTGLDDDDEFRPSRLEGLVSAWNSSPAASQSISCLFTESILTDGVWSTVTTDRKDEVGYLDLFEHNFIGNQVFCPTERYREIGGFDEGMPAWQDLEMFMRLVKRFGTAHRLNDATYVCYVDRGRDRISMNATRRYGAFERIVRKNAELPAEHHQRLFLQLFSAFYGTVPSRADWRRMLRWKASPRLLAKLLRASIRNRLRGPS